MPFELGFQKAGRLSNRGQQAGKQVIQRKSEKAQRVLTLRILTGSTLLELELRKASRLNSEDRQTTPIWLFCAVSGGQNSGLQARTASALPELLCYHPSPFLLTPS